MFGEVMKFGGLLFMDHPIYESLVSSGRASGQNCSNVFFMALSFRHIV